MILHTVAPGETISSVGRQYGLSPGLIARVNGLQPPYRLAVGQSLLLLFPRQVHTVQPGQTLGAVAEEYGVSPLTLLRNNPNLQGRAALYPGQVLVIAWTDTPTRPVEVNGYAYPYVDPAVLRGILPYSTFLTPFTYGVSADGGLVDLEDQALIDLARQYGVTPLMHLSTLTETGSFSNARAAFVLEDPARQQALAELVTQQVVSRGYGGVDVDFEFIYPENAQLYADFVGVLRAEVNTLGMELITALAPKSSADQPGVLYEGHDYRRIGENSDAVLLMTYEWGYTSKQLRYRRREMTIKTPTRVLTLVGAALLHGCRQLFQQIGTIFIGFQICNCFVCQTGSFAQNSFIQFC